MARADDLNKKLTDAMNNIHVLEEELKDIFLEAICEPFQTTLVLLDLRNQSLEQVVDKALAMDRMHNNNTMNLSMLHRNLPTLEELRFRQVVQCMTCLKTSNVIVRFVIIKQAM